MLAFLNAKAEEQRLTKGGQSNKQQADMTCLLASLAGKVRKECVEGLRRVIGLHRVEWARQVASLNLLPTCSMLTLLDKKFGGELTKEDVQVNCA